MQARDAADAGWSQIHGRDLAGWKLAMSDLAVKQTREINELNNSIINFGPINALAHRQQKEVDELKGAYEAQAQAAAGNASSRTQQQRGSASTDTAASIAARTDWTRLHLQPTSTLQHPQQQEQEQQEVDEQHPQVPWRLKHQQQQEQEQQELDSLYGAAEEQQGQQQQDQTAQQQPQLILDDEEQKS